MKTFLTTKPTPRFIVSTLQRLTVTAAALALVCGPGRALAQRPLGVDVSDIQGSGINWTSVKGAGYTFSWAKATEGTGYTASSFVPNETHGKAAGVYMGAYDFTRPDLVSPRSESAFFWSVAGGYIKGDGKSLMPMMDVETFNGVVGASSYADWCNQWGNDIVNDGAAVGLNLTPVLYTTTCEACNLSGSVSQWIPWIANPSGEGSQTGNPWDDTSCDSCDWWGGWTIWQYSWSGSVSGISGVVDLDAFNGTASTLTSTLVVQSGLKAPAIFYDAGNGNMNIYRWESSGSAFSEFSTSTIDGYVLTNVGSLVVASDVNGDGIMDAVAAYQYPDGTMRLHVFINGNSYAGAQGWFESGQFNLANVGGRMVGGDFNGDGKGDVAMFYDNGNGSMTIFRFLSTGTNFTVDSHVISGYFLTNVNNNIAAADINHDGKTDVVLAYQYPDGTMRLHAFMQGYSYAGPGGWYASGGPFSLSRVGGRMVGGDFNGDGKGDVAMLYDIDGSNMNIYRFLSSGTNFTIDTHTLNGYVLTNVNKNVAAGDINGDGLCDIVTAYQYPDGTMRFHAFIDGYSYAGPGGWYESGPFSLSNVNGRFILGNW